MDYWTAWHKISFHFTVIFPFSSSLIWFVAIDCCDSSVTDISAEVLEIGCKYQEKKNTSSLNKILWQNINIETEKYKEVLEVFEVKRPHWWRNERNKKSEFLDLYIILSLKCFDIKNIFSGSKMKIWVALPDQKERSSLSEVKPRYGWLNYFLLKSSCKKLFNKCTTTIKSRTRRKPRIKWFKSTCIHPVPLTSQGNSWVQEK